MTVAPVDQIWVITRSGKPVVVVDKLGGLLVCGLLLIEQPTVAASIISSTILKILSIIFFIWVIPPLLFLLLETCLRILYHSFSREQNRRGNWPCHS